MQYIPESITLCISTKMLKFPGAVDPATRKRFGYTKSLLTQPPYLIDYNTSSASCIIASATARAFPHKGISIDLAGSSNPGFTR